MRNNIFVNIINQFKELWESVETKGTPYDFREDGFMQDRENIRKDWENVIGKWDEDDHE